MGEAHSSVYSLPGPLLARVAALLAVDLLLHEHRRDRQLVLVCGACVASACSACVAAVAVAALPLRRGGDRVGPRLARGVEEVERRRRRRRIEEEEEEGASRPSTSSWRMCGGRKSRISSSS